ncbi:MAG: SMC family ATPase [Nanoarchaeota archaeon]
MKLLKLIINNIRSYSSGEIVFPEGSTLLSGDIGSGKTTILLAIEFALFGLQPGQKASGLLSGGESEGSVSLEFEIDNEPIIIERTLKRGPKSISHESAFLTYQGLREELSVTELKTRVLALLHYPEEFIKRTNLLYRYTVYSPQEEMKQIIMEDQESRLNVIRHIFGIDKYRKIRENLAIMTSRLREEFRLLTSEVKELEVYREKIQANKQNLIVLNAKAISQQKIIAENKSKRKEVELEVKSLEQKISEKRNFEKEIEKTQVLVSAKSQQLGEITKNISDIEKLKPSGKSFDKKVYEEILAKISQNDTLSSSLNSKYIENSSKLKLITSKKNEEFQKRARIFEIKICPTCLQDVSDFHKHNILNEVESKQSELDKELIQLQNELKFIEAEIEKCNLLGKQLFSEKSEQELSRIKDEEAKKSSEQLSVIVKSQDSLKKDIDFLNSHLMILKQAVLEFTKYDNLFRLKEEELRNLFNEEKKSEIFYAELKKEEELLGKDIAILEKTIQEKEKIQLRISYINKIENWMSNEFLNIVTYTERNIMLKLRMEFSNLFSKWFSLLTTDTFYVQLDETFTPIILQGDYELDYSFLSGGERTAVALAYRLALNQLINSMFSNIKTKDMLILDEPTDGFSEQQLDKVRDILHELNLNQLIIVSHEQKIEGFVDNIIKLRKENGKTIIESKTQ